MNRNLKATIGTGLLIAGTLIYLSVIQYRWAAMAPVQRGGFVLVGALLAYVSFSILVFLIGFFIGRHNGLLNSTAYLWARLKNAIARFYENTVREIS